MTDLIDKLERADGPDRELDAEIRAVSLGDLSGCAFPTVEKWVAEALSKKWVYPAYTASIDAAMTLVPEGVPVTLVMAGSGQAFIDSPDPCGGYAGACEYAATPALALCVAALRARSQGGE